jgi:hypothetical protein
MAQALFQSASQPKQLYLVSGADHNDIVEIGGQILEDRIRAFLQTIQRIDSSGVSRPGFRVEFRKFQKNVRATMKIF